MQESVLLGDEALAQGCSCRGYLCLRLSGDSVNRDSRIYSQYIQVQAAVLSSWCSNEKTAYEAALGTSLVGRRALVTMKHVGLNVAMDPFVNSALLDIKGGLSRQLLMIRECIHRRTSRTRVSCRLCKGDML